MSDRILSHGRRSRGFAWGRHISRKIKLEGCKKIMGVEHWGPNDRKWGWGYWGVAASPLPLATGLGAQWAPLAGSGVEPQPCHVVLIHSEYVRWSVVVVNLWSQNWVLGMLGGVEISLGYGLNPLIICRRDTVCFASSPKMSHSFIQDCCWITLQV